MNSAPDFVRRLSPFAWLLALSICCGIVACKTLPDVDPDVPAKATPTIATTKGALPPQQASALVAKRWASASGDLKALAALEEQATGVPLIAGNKVTLLFDGPATMREMMAAARAATSSINLETYIFDADEIGNQFADVLIEKQRQGVAVNIMVDAVGALATPTAFFDRMRSAGIGVQVNYIPVYWHPVFEDLGYRRGTCPVAEAAYEELLSLPLVPGMSDDDLDRVVDTLAAILGT
jgi:cardiolipin synthase